MPLVTIFFVRSSLIYLLLGVTLGSLLLAEKGVHFQPFLWRLLPAHIEFLLIGFTLQLAMGVAYWIFPRFLAGGAERGSVFFPALSYLLLNSGVVLVGVGEALLWDSSLLLLGKSMELFSAFLFVLSIFRRVKPLFRP